MATEPSDTQPESALAANLERLEARLARIEAHLGFDTQAVTAGETGPAPPEVSQGGDELEFKIGQEWFARVGIATLGIGAAFTLSLPYANLPPAAPSAVGYVLAAALIVVAGLCRRRLELVSRYLRATGMALGYFSSLRLCFFGDRHALSADSAGGELLLALSAAVLLAIGLRRRSTWLFGLGLFACATTAVAVGSPSLGLALVAVFSVAAAATGVWLGRMAPILVAMPLAYAAYAVWALNNPLLGRTLGLVAGPPWAPAVILVCIAAFSAALHRFNRGDRDNTAANAGIFLNAAVGYPVYLLHTLGSFSGELVGFQLAAAVVLIGLAFLHSGEAEGIGAFVCAMSGFLALSCAIIKAAPMPAVFVWLSVQSVVVVATAIWLRSRFIIVANFGIYVGILASYVVVAEGERGISLGFGVVALVTARLLSWKQERLVLKTGLMRNCYLIVAFLIFPYALYHLVPRAWVSLAWVGASLLYYLLAALLHNPKYRWMAHATLVLTAVYLAVAGISRLEPVFRNLSFLVLGAVFLVVSLVFTRLRARHRAAAPRTAGPGQD